MILPLFRDYIKEDGSIKEDQKQNLEIRWFIKKSGGEYVIGVFDKEKNLIIRGGFLCCFHSFDSTRGLTFPSGVKSVFANHFNVAIDEKGKWIPTDEEYERIIKFVDTMKNL